MKHIVRVAYILLGVLIGFGGSAYADVILKFNSLPSVQGWTYSSGYWDPGESNIFSISDGILYQNSLGKYDAAPGYEIFDMVDPSLPFTLKVCARVLEEEWWGNNHDGLHFSVSSGTELFMFGIGPNVIVGWAGNESTVISSSIDNTVFHVYVMKGTFGVGYEFYVDGALTATIPTQAFTHPNLLSLGDGTGGANAKAEISCYEFTQQPSEVSVVIDIKPGSFPNSINPRSKGKIPVAILTSETFDATTVDTSTVFFGATGTEALPVHAALEDVDGDGDLDMILHFETQGTGIQCGDTSASLKGKTKSKQAIKGSDSIKTVGCH